MKPLALFIYSDILDYCIENTVPFPCISMQRYQFIDCVSNQNRQYHLKEKKIY